jgi:transcriptional regulator with XRE-family HTH domain
MPKLIVNRRGKRKVPPCGRLIKYVEPHSPFQKLVFHRMTSQKISGRELARKLIVDGQPVSQSTFWIWLHNENGFPHPKAFTPDHLRQLAKAIKVPISQLEQALDASRHLYTVRENPMPRPAFDAFERFIDIIANDKRKTISRSYVVNLAKTLYNGSAASVRPVPRTR